MVINKRNVKNKYKLIKQVSAFKNTNKKNFLQYKEKRQIINFC